MGRLATPHVSDSFLPTAVERRSDRTAVHTGNCSQTTTEVTVRTPEGGLKVCSEGLRGALHRRGPFSRIFKGTTQLPLFHCPQAIFQYRCSILPAPAGTSGPCPQALEECSGTTGKFYFQVEGRFCGLPTFELFTTISPTPYT